MESAGSADELMLKAVLFDLDDTLIDWSDFDIDWGDLQRRHLRGVVDYFQQEGHFRADLDTFMQAYQARVMDAWGDAGRTMRAVNVGSLMLDAAVDLGAQRERVNMDACLEAYAWDVIPGTVVFPDVPAVLDLLRQHGVEMGIVTNAPQPMTLRDNELVGHGLIDYFPVCRISAADVGVVKPHPDIFRRALKTLNVQRDEVVFVGDDLDADIRGAGALGIRTILRITRKVDYSARTDVVPDARVRTYDEMPALLDAWFPGWR
jgi:HAD superfamily hydrolase (TIGR01509 family)